MTSTPRPETITRLLEAVFPSFAMLAGMELDLFTHLSEGSRSVEHLAQALEVQPAKLGPLLYALVVAGLLTVEGDLFANTPEAEHYLVRGKPSYLGGTRELTSSTWAKVLKTAATIRAGGPLDTYDYHTAPKDELVALFRGLYPGSVADARSLMAMDDFSAYDTLLDVGGGSGALAITIAQANPHLKATVGDLPLVTPITRQFVEEAGLADHVEIKTIDAVREPLSGLYDVIVARSVVQVLSVDDNRALVRNLFAALNPGGVLHLIGWILDDSRLTPKNIVGYNLVLLVNYEDGQAYTEREYGEWLTEAGFVEIKRSVMPDGVSIVTARKPT